MIQSCTLKKKRCTLHSKQPYRVQNKEPFQNFSIKTAVRTRNTKSGSIWLKHSLVSE